MMRKTGFVAVWLVCISLPDAVLLLNDRSTNSSGQQGEPAAPSQTVNQYAQSLDAFKGRLTEYLTLRARIVKDVPEVKETGDPAKISAREQALGRAIAAARASAKPGDLFGPDLTPHLTQIVRKDWTSRPRSDREALFEEFPAGVVIKVNAPYPTSVPLVSVPAALLADLPALPEELEYRLVGRHVLLRDRDANLVLDVLFNVIPR